MSVKLKSLGHVTNNCLLILHGLFGNKNNFSSIVKYLTKKGINSVSLDLRNHGESPWSDSCQIQDMARDVKDFIQDHKIEKVNVLGHSLGGKVGMKLALEYPNLLNSLIVVDMSPFSKRNPTEMLSFVKGMKDSQTSGKRQDIKLALKQVVDDPMVLEFLMTNLVKKDDDSFKFRINLNALERDIPLMLQEEIPSADQRYDGNTLFIGAKRADYLKETEHDKIKRIFTRAEFKYLDTGHWVHFEKPSEFLDLVTGFLKRF